jgi:hypothetical protein
MSQLGTGAFDAVAAGCLAALFPRVIELRTDMTTARWMTPVGVHSSAVLSHLLSCASSMLLIDSAGTAAL